LRGAKSTALPVQQLTTFQLVIAEHAQTKYCIRQGASCDHPSGKVKIDAAYVLANAPIIREQLQKSGVRLAHLLDAASLGPVSVPGLFFDLRMRRAIFPDCFSRFSP
jgi:hypothetical protein